MNILVVAPYYAPSSEVPSVRMISLTSYLVSVGHNVTVVCWSREKLLTLYKESELSSCVPDGVEVVEFNSIKKSLPFIDDIRFGYDLKKKLPSLVDLKKFDIAFVTCGPYFTLEAMPYIKKTYDLKYVLDFRDLGALNYRPELRNDKINRTKFWKKPIKAWYRRKVATRERKAVESADGIICVSPIDKKIMQAEYAIEDSKCIIATNGFDDIKLAQVTPTAKENGIVGAVFGKFMYYSQERAEALLIGINKQRKLGVNIKLKHIGRHFDYIDVALKRNEIDDSTFEKCGLMEYSVGMSVLGSADFFVVEDTSPDDVGTKIYDYIYWNKPIIASVPKDIPLAKLVSTFEHGYVCDSEEEINAALKDIVEHRYNVLDSNLDIMNYSRTYQNKKMEQFMLGISE